jgi:site-specific recombinase XerD
LFPGKRPDKPYAHASIQKAIKSAAARANIKKRVYPHVLRHTYATGLLEAGVDILTISRLLGHASFMTTMIYLHCRRENLSSIPSPLDWLPVQQLPTYRPATENGNEQNPPSEPPANQS